MFLEIFSKFILLFAILYWAVFLIRKLLKVFLWRSIDKNNEIDVKGKSVLITGANSGIGQAAALEFATRGANVILACRDEAKAKEAMQWIKTKTKKGHLVFMKLDLSSLQSVREFAKEFKSKFDRLDILVNNAGVSFPIEENKKTQDGFEVHIGVNHLGHFLLTNLLLDELKKGAPSRIITVSSTGHSWSKLDLDDLMSEKSNRKEMKKFELYCKSKMANALFSKELANKLRGTGVTTYCLCPGLVSTDIGRNMDGMIAIIMAIMVLLFGKTAEDGAATIMHCALNKKLASESGEMYQHCGNWDPKSRAEQKDKDAKRLWEESAKLVGIKK